MAEASCSTQTKQTSNWSRWVQWMEPYLGADLRSLALTRVAVASVVLLDLALRARDLVAHYSDLGILPRSAWLRSYGTGWRVSLHLLSGQPGVIAALFVIAAIFALMLLVGYRTRLASVVSFVLLVSLQARNPMVLIGADNVMSMMLLWGMFVPWGARYSIDAALDPDGSGIPKRIFSLGSAAILLQMPLIYFFTGVLKSGATWTTDLTAVAYTLRAEHFTTPLGKLLGELPQGLLAAATVGVLILEIAGSLLLFFPFRKAAFRLCIVALFTLLQIGFGLSLYVGVFPLISIAAMLPWLPTEFWDWLSRRRPKAQVHYDLDCGFCRKSSRILTTFLAQPLPVPAQLDSSIHADMEKMRSWVVVFEGKRYFEWEGFVALVRASVLAPLAPILSWAPIAKVGRLIYRSVADRRDLAGVLTKGLKEVSLPWKLPIWASLLCLVLLGYTLLGTVGSVVEYVRAPPKMSWLQRMVQLQTRWSMFAPNPPRSTRWVVVEGTLANGETVEIMTGGAVPEGKPELVSSWYPNHRWRKYMTRVSDSKYRRFRAPITAWACRSWNASHSGEMRVESVRLLWNRENSSLRGEEVPIKQGRLAYRTCSGARKSTPVAAKPRVRPGAAAVQAATRALEERSSDPAQNSKPAEVEKASGEESPLPSVRLQRVDAVPAHVPRSALD